MKFTNYILRQIIKPGSNIAYESFIFQRPHN